MSYVIYAVKHFVVYSSLYAILIEQQLSSSSHLLDDNYKVCAKKKGRRKKMKNIRSLLYNFNKNMNPFGRHLVLFSILGRNKDKGNIIETTYNNDKQHLV